MDYKQTKERLLTAEKLLNESSTTREKINALRTILHGINPRIDNLVDSCMRELGKLEKLKKGEVIELSVETLPEGTEEQKKRKKALLLFLRYWKDLKSEVSRIRGEFEQKKESPREQIKSAGRIVALAKGPLGIITAVAVVAVVGASIFKPKVPTRTPSTNTVKVIVVAGQKIPLSEVEVVTGSECDSAPHYHARDRVVAKSIDGTLVPDPGGCGYGKVSEIPVEEV